MAGAPKRFEEFFAETNVRLFGALCLVTRSRAEAEEIAQEAYVRVWERWDRVAAMEDPAGFLFRTAMNVFRSRYRRAAIALRRTVAPTPAPDDIDAAVDRHVVLEALSELTPQQRAAVVLTSMYEYSSEDAGRLLGMRPSTVRSLAMRARANLRRTVGERP